jgi:hypothetical protein
VATWLDVIAPKLAEKEKEISQQNVDPFDIACDNRNCQQLNFYLSFDQVLKSVSFLVVGIICYYHKAFTIIESPYSC